MRVIAFPVTRCFMKKFLALIVSLVTLSGAAAFAVEQPSVYVIQKGDTLWGLSERFFSDPWYWPDLWAKNPDIANPHLIFPGQKVKVYADRIEIEPPAPKARKAEPATTQKPVEEAVPEKRFSVPGGSGFIEKDTVKSTGTIIATYNNRVVVGENDLVYTNIGSRDGAKPGDMFSVYRKGDAVSHPVINTVLGYKTHDMGAVRLTEVLENSSKGVITSSNREIQVNDLLRPYREPIRKVALKKGEKDIRGYLVASSTGTEIMAEGDAVYIDKGIEDGVVAGNLLYVVKEINPLEQDSRKVKLPLQVQGALVVVETGKNVSTGVIVKSSEPMYRGDRILLNISR